MSKRAPAPSPSQPSYAAMPIMGRASYNMLPWNGGFNAPWPVRIRAPGTQRCTSGLKQAHARWWKGTLPKFGCCQSGSGQKRPGANRPPEFVPESPSKKGSCESYFLRRNYRENAHSKSANFEGRTLWGPLARPAPFVYFRPEDY